MNPLYDVLPRSSHAFERLLHLGVGPRRAVARARQDAPALRHLDEASNAETRRCLPWSSEGNVVFKILVQGNPMESGGLHRLGQVIRKRLDMGSGVDVLVQQSEECLEGWG